MSVSSRNHIVGWFVLLEHEPHRPYIIEGVAPVPGGLQIPQPQLAGKAQVNLCDVRRDLASYELEPAPWAFVIEKNPARCMELVSLAVVAGEVEACNLRYTVSGARVKRRFFGLRALLRLTEHFARSGEIEMGLRRDLAERGKHVV